MLLAYRFLLAAPRGLTVVELDTQVETWLRDAGQGDIDFEVTDAVSKLRRLEVIDGRFTMQAVPLPDSLALLDRRWDDLFRHQPNEGGAPIGSCRPKRCHGRKNSPTPHSPTSCRRPVFAAESVNVAPNARARISRETIQITSP